MKEKSTVASKDSYWVVTMVRRWVTPMVDLLDHLMAARSADTTAESMAEWRVVAMVHSMVAHSATALVIRMALKSAVLLAGSRVGAMVEQWG